MQVDAQMIRVCFSDWCSQGGGLVGGGAVGSRYNYSLIHAFLATLSTEVAANSCVNVAASEASVPA